MILDIIYVPNTKIDEQKNTDINLNHGYDPIDYDYYKAMINAMKVKPNYLIITDESYLWVLLDSLSLDKKFRIWIHPGDKLKESYSQATTQLITELINKKYKVNILSRESSIEQSSHNIHCKCFYFMKYFHKNNPIYNDVEFQTHIEIKELDSESINNHSEIRFLYRQLKELSHVIDYFIEPINGKLEVKGEPELNKYILRYFRIMFPKAENAPNSTFKSTLGKGYLPDIVIDDLKLAIEMKLIKATNKPEDISTYIDQVHTDEQNYVGNDKYKLFFAVFYIEDSKITKEQFDIEWASKIKSKNWIPILVKGKQIVLTKDKNIKHKDKKVE